ncbi:MAG: hypothetical protein V8Q41_00650 [Anaerostipes hadrus]
MNFTKIYGKKKQNFYLTFLFKNIGFLILKGSCKKNHYRMKEQDLKRMSMMEMLLQDKTMTKMLAARE